MLPPLRQLLQNNKVIDRSLIESIVADLQDRTHDEHMIFWLAYGAGLRRNEIDKLKNSSQSINNLKILLANETTAMLHGTKVAKESEETAQKTFVEKSIGKNLPTIKVKKSIISNGINILDFILFRDKVFKT